MPGRSARPSKGDHSPRFEALEHHGHAARWKAGGQGDRFWCVQGAEPATDREVDLYGLRPSAYAEILRIIKEEEPPLPSLKVSTLGEEATVIAEHRHTDPKQLRRA